MIRRVAFVVLLSVLSVRIVDASSFGRAAGKSGVSPIGAQHSISAIRQASSLSAPPNPSVFSQSVILNCAGLPFAPDSSGDDYEFTRHGPASGVTLAQSQERLSH